MNLIKQYDDDDDNDGDDDEIKCKLITIFFLWMKITLDTEIFFDTCWNCFCYDDDDYDVDW